MEFLHSFVPVFMKCDFTTSAHGSNVAKVSETGAENNATVLAILLYHIFDCCGLWGGMDENGG